MDGPVRGRPPPGRYGLAGLLALLHLLAGSSDNAWKWSSLSCSRGLVPGCCSPGGRFDAPRWSSSSAPGSSPPTPPSRRMASVRPRIYLSPAGGLRRLSGHPGGGSRGLPVQPHGRSGDDVGRVLPFLPSSLGRPHPRHPVRQLLVRHAHDRAHRAGHHAGISRRVSPAAHAARNVSACSSSGTRSHLACWRRGAGVWPATRPRPRLFGDFLRGSGGKDGRGLLADR